MALTDDQIHEMAALIECSNTKRDYERFIEKANTAISKNGRRLYSAVAARISGNLCMRRTVLRCD